MLKIQKTKYLDEVADLFDLVAVYVSIRIDVVFIFTDFCFYFQSLLFFADTTFVPIFVNKWYFYFACCWKVAISPP